jgi:ribosomal protein S18 acetylase RimI-like enzyme
MISHGTSSDLLQAPVDRRQQRQRQLAKYHLLQPVPVDEQLRVAAGFPQDPGPNDAADLEVLSTLASGAASWLVTNDSRLRARARRAGLGERVLSIADALGTLRPLLASPTELPAATTVPGYRIALNASIFDSLRAQYPQVGDDPGFDVWWRNKVAGEHRDVIVLGDPAEPDGIAVLKPEDDRPHGLPPSLLKVCTFKVADVHQGSKRGELLLKAVIDYARQNRLEHVYLEVRDELADLIGWLAEFGFQQVPEANTHRGEQVLHKPLIPSTRDEPLAPLDHHVRYGPGAVLVQAAHVVPIRAHWHNRLLPEADTQGDLLAGMEACGNAIRKAYLCHSNTTLLQQGDLLLFRRTQSGPASITAVGIVEDTTRSDSPEEVVSFVGSRTVYSRPEITRMCAHKEVLAVRFRLDRVLDPPWPDPQVRSQGLVRGNVQTISRVPEEGLQWLRQQLVA